MRYDAMTPNAIEATGLIKRFGKTMALDDVDLVARQGRVLGVLGPNGAGKTTAVRILATLLRPDDGQATSAGSVTGASGTNQAAVPVRPDVSVASRVLATPPGPVRVTRRAPASAFSTRATSCSRPTNLVSGRCAGGGELDPAGATTARSE